MALLSLVVTGGNWGRRLVWSAQLGRSVSSTARVKSYIGEDAFLILAYVSSLFFETREDAFLKDITFTIETKCN